MKRSTFDKIYERGYAQGMWFGAILWAAIMTVSEDIGGQARAIERAQHHWVEWYYGTPIVLAILLGTLYYGHKRRERLEQEIREDDE